MLTFLETKQNKKTIVTTLHCIQLKIIIQEISGGLVPTCSPGLEHSRDHTASGALNKGPGHRNCQKAPFTTLLLLFHMNASTCLNARNPWLMYQDVLKRKHRNKAVSLLKAALATVSRAVVPQSTLPLVEGQFYAALTPFMPSHLPHPFASGASPGS